MSEEKKFDSTKYKNDFQRQKYDRLIINVPKGKGDIIKKYAKGEGKSLNAYVVNLIQTDMSLQHNKGVVKSADKKSVMHKMNLSHPYANVENNYFAYYMICLIESRTEVYLIDNVFEKYKHIDNKIIYQEFKRNIVALCEAAKLVLLRNEEAKKRFNDMRYILLYDNVVRQRYIELEKFYEENKDFFRRARNLISHFDHTKEKTFWDIIKRGGILDLAELNGLPSDEKLPMYATVLLELYISLYKKNSENDLDYDAMTKEMIDFIAKFANLLIEALDAMLACFFRLYTNWETVKDGNDTEILWKQELVSVEELYNREIQHEVEIAHEAARKTKESLEVDEKPIDLK